LGDWLPDHLLSRQGLADKGAGTYRPVCGVDDHELGTGFHVPER